MNKFHIEEAELELEISKIGKMFYSPELDEKRNYLKDQLQQLRRKNEFKLKEEYAAKLLETYDITLEELQYALSLDEVTREFYLEIKPFKQREEHMNNNFDIQEALKGSPVFTISGDAVTNITRVYASGNTYIAGVLKGGIRLWEETGKAEGGGFIDLTLVTTSK